MCISLRRGANASLGAWRSPTKVGLEGHSDADVLAHAIADALLGAAALGDIGKYYPPSDMKFKDLDSMVIVRECAERLRQAGGNGSTTWMR
jgi:2-C-methyl-D-erythritol 2,4-cyclodiphosphate synthase